MKQIRPSVVEQNPKANVVEITKLVADHWNKVESAVSKNNIIQSADKRLGPPLVMKVFGCRKKCTNVSGYQKRTK